MLFELMDLTNQIENTKNIAYLITVVTHKILVRK